MGMKYLVLGDSFIDVYRTIEEFKASPEQEGAFVYKIVETKRTPGGAANVARNLFSLSNETVHLSTISNFWTSERTGVRDDLCWMYGSALVKERIISSKSSKQIMRIDSPLSYNKAEREKYEDKLFKHRDIFAEYDCIIISDYCKGIVSSKVISLLEDFEGPIIIDTKMKDWFIFKDLKDPLFKINAKEFRNIQTLTNHKIVVTNGSAGCSFYDNGLSKHRVQGKRVKDANTIGAGDSFLAGLAYGLLSKKLTLFDSMAYADQVARASVRNFGTSVVTTNDLKSEDSHDGSLRNLF